MPPEELDQVLRRLPLRIAVSIPADLLEAWFAPRSGVDPIAEEALTAAAAYARRFECEFQYDSDRKEALLWKWVPAI